MTAISILGITPRQRPCTDRFDDLMELAEATARAIDDNAWDEGQPWPQLSGCQNWSNGNDNLPHHPARVPDVNEVCPAGALGI
jgi:hypothetical protein